MRPSCLAVALVVVLFPVALDAQLAPRALTWDLHVGRAAPLRRLRNDSMETVRRPSGIAFGGGVIVAPDARVMYRVGAEIARSGLDLRANRGVQFIPRGSTSRLDRWEYDFTADAALRLLAATTPTGRTAYALRTYGGGGVRAAHDFEIVCISDFPCTSASRYGSVVRPTARAGLLLTRRRPGATIRLDIGYQLWRPSGVMQHDLRTTIGLGR